jgi:hypothetical protein
MKRRKAKNAARRAFRKEILLGRRRYRDAGYARQYIFHVRLFGTLCRVTNTFSCWIEGS